MRASGYIAWLGGTVVFLTAGVVALTIAVDPYYLFGTAAVAGWNELKPRAYQQTAIAKQYQLERVAPRLLILGNSRSEIGIDPQSPCWPANERPVFNAAMAGGSVFQSLLMLREAIAVRAPDRIILGIDFLDAFTEGKAPATPSPDERRLLVDRNGYANPSRGYQRWQDRLAATLTIDAVADSVLTVFQQNPETSATMTPAGFNPLHEYRVMVARNGYHGLFAQKNAIYRKQYASYAKPQFTGPSSNPAFRHLESIIHLAREHAIPLVLYVHPYHADLMELLHDLDLWSTFEAWKRALAAAIDQVDQSAPGAVRLVDFSGYNQFTIEPVPAAGDRRAQMQWYWEAGHYKSALGEHILATIFGTEPQARVEARFGRDLTSTNIDAALFAIRQERTRFLAARKRSLQAVDEHR